MRRKIAALFLALFVLHIAGAWAEKLGEEVKLVVTAETKSAIIMTLRNEYDRDTFVFKSGKTEYGYWGKNGASLVRLDGEVLKGKLGTLVFKINEDAIPGEYKITFRVVNAYDLSEQKAKVTIPEYLVMVEDTLLADPDKIQGFVERCYEVFLSRGADPGGLEYWTQRLIDRHENATGVIMNIMGSQEFLGRNMSSEDVVESLYLAMLGRGSDELGKAGWQEKLDAGCSESLIINGFGGSAEFQSLCFDYGMRPGRVDDSEPRNANVALTAFVSRCYRVGLQRAADPGGLNNWCGDLMAGRKTPRQVVEGFVQSEEMTGRNLSDAEYVETMYRLYLGREADPEGEAYWLERLASGMSREELNGGFADSQEFHTIVQGYGLE